MENMLLNGQITTSCILSAAGNGYTNPYLINIIFTTKGTKLYVFIVTSSGKDNQKLSKCLSKGFERSAYWNECKIKSEKKIRQINTDIFSNPTLLESIEHLF